MALLAAAALLALVLFTALGSFPRGLIAAGLVVVGLRVVAAAVVRRGPVRLGLLVLAGALLVGSLVLVIVGGLLIEGIALVAVATLMLAAARRALRVHVALPGVEPPCHPVMVWNPRSGGGKAARAGLADEARARGIEPIELRPGDDLIGVVRNAVARGADGLAAAGGDGTQAAVATIAAEHDLPFACIPAGTRNHFALDLGVDRDDLVGALDAFVEGGERVVDLAEVNGRTFVNNTSLGLYAEAVQRAGYREAKLRTILDTAPEVLGPATGDRGGGLRWTDAEGTRHRAAAVILVSNNQYRLGHVLGSGTRPAVDDGLLGVAVMTGERDSRGRGSLAWRQWTSEALTVDSDSAVPIGVDGEALTMEPPLRFRIRAGVLRVRIAHGHPGASPSTAQPSRARDVIRALARIALGSEVGRGVAPGRGESTQGGRS